MPGAEQQTLNDPARLELLRRSQLLDGATTPMLDRLTRITSTLLEVPISLVSLVDNAGQHFPGLTGLSGWAGERRGTALSHSFCQHVVINGAPLIIGNAHASAIVADNLAVDRLGVVSYAGVPLRTADGHTLGALCAIDGESKVWTAEQVAILEDVAALVVQEIEAHTERVARGESPDGQATEADEMTRDPLTGLLNGRGLLAYGDAIGATGSPADAPFSIVSLDIDGFRAFNEQFGYDRGNARLQQVAGLLHSLVGEAGVAARVGVDEFVVVLPQATDVECLAFVSRVREAISAHSAYVAPAEAFTLSIGCATSTALAPMRFAQLLLHAEVEMYRAMGTRLQSAETDGGH